LCKIGNKARHTCTLFSEAYAGDAVKRSSVPEWHKQFKENHEKVEDEETSGHPRCHKTDENVKKLRNLVHLDRCFSTRAMAVQLNLGKETSDVRRKRPEFWPNDWNAPAHKALSVKQFLAQKSITEIEHPSCSPYLAPKDF
jgi:hypothetical protein